MMNICVFSVIWYSYIIICFWFEIRQLLSYFHLLRKTCNWERWHSTSMTRRGIHVTVVWSKLIKVMASFFISPIAAYMRRQTRSALVPVVACHLFGVITRTNTGLLSIGHSGTNFSENLIEIQIFYSQICKTLSAKWQPFCPGMMP